MWGSQPRCRLGSLPFYMGHFILLEGVYIYKHALIRFVHDSYGEYRSEWWFHIGRKLGHATLGPSASSVPSAFFTAIGPERFPSCPSASRPSASHGSSLLASFGRRLRLFLFWRSAPFCTPRKRSLVLRWSASSHASFGFLAVLLLWFNLPGCPFGICIHQNRRNEEWGPGPQRPCLKVLPIHYSNYPSLYL